MRKLNLTQRIAVEECMGILSTHIASLETVTDVSLYTVFETLINDEFDIPINNLQKFFKDEIPKHIFELQKLNKKQT